MTLLAGLHLTGSEGGTAFVDVAGNTFTRGAGLTTTTAQYPPNGADSCAFFPSASNGYLTATNSNFAVGTGDFYVRFWIRYPSLSNSNQPVFAFGGTYFSQNTSYQLYSMVPFFGQYWSVTIGLNTWRYFELTRSGSTIYVFLDGTLVSSWTADSSSLSGTTLTLGGNGQYATFYMGDFEFANAAGHTSNYTVPNTQFGDNIFSFPGVTTAQFTSAATKATSYSFSGSSAMFFPNTVGAFSAPSSSSAAFGQYNPILQGSSSTTASFGAKWRFEAPFNAAGNTTPGFVVDYKAQVSSSTTLSIDWISLRSGTFSVSGQSSAQLRGQYEATARLLGVCKSTVLLASNSRHSAPVAALGSSRLNFIGRGIRPSTVNAVSATQLMLFGTSVVKASYSTPLTTSISAFGQAGRLTILRVAGGSAGSFSSSYTIQPVAEVHPDAGTITAFSRQKVIYVVG